MPIPNEGRKSENLITNVSTRSEASLFRWNAVFENGLYPIVYEELGAAITDEVSSGKGQDYQNTVV